MRVFRKFRAVFLVLVFMFTVSACAHNNSVIRKSEKPQITFLLAENQGADYPTTRASLKFSALVYDRTKGRIKIDVYPSAQLGEEKAALEQIQIGAIDFLRVHSSPLAEFNAQFAIFSLPYVFESDAHLWKFLGGKMAGQMLDNLQSSKMQGLAYYTNGARNLYFSKPVYGLEDLKGRRVRVQQNKVTMDMISALGAVPVPMPYAEVLSSLQEGSIDGAENNFPSYFTSNHYQYARYCILSRHQRAPEILLISKLTWDKLSPEDQKIIKQAAVEASQFQRQLWSEFERESEERLRKSGITIIEVENLDSWREATKPVYEKHDAALQQELQAIHEARP